jgi:hypothetical protein
MYIHKVLIQDTWQSAAKEYKMAHWSYLPTFNFVGIDEGLRISLLTKQKAWIMNCKGFNLSPGRKTFDGGF